MTAECRLFVVRVKNSNHMHWSHSICSNESIQMLRPPQLWRASQARTRHDSRSPFGGKLSTSLHFHFFCFVLFMNTARSQLRAAWMDMVDLWFSHMISHKPSPIERRYSVVSRDCHVHRIQFAHKSSNVVIDLRYIRLHMVFVGAIFLCLALWQKKTARSAAAVAVAAAVNKYFHFNFVPKKRFSPAMQTLADRPLIVL